MKIQLNIKYVIIFFVTICLSKLYSQVPSTWTINPNAYQYQMTLTGKVSTNCIDLKNTNNYIAAFVNGQCRGIISTNTIFNGNYLGLLTISSNVTSGEKVNFKMYDAVTNTIFDALDSMIFSQGAQIGTLSNPFMMYTNHPPTKILMSSLTIPEKSPIGTVVANLNASDPDLNTIFTFSLTSTQIENSQFLISGDSLMVNTIFDYSTDSIKIIEIQVSDNNGCSYVETFTLHITNTNTQPNSISFNYEKIFNNQRANGFVGTFRTNDNNINDTHLYALVNGTYDTDNWQFYIQNDTLYNVNSINYESQSLYHIRVRSTDNGGLYVEKAFDVIVLPFSDENQSFVSTNYISPNGDGKNDFWKIKNIERYKDFNLQIFDQFGQIIFEVANNYNNEFDGKYKGKPLPSGNYYYIFKNEKTTYKGNITIVN